jgi:hypothetical protein
MKKVLLIAIVALGLGSCKKQTIEPTFPTFPVNPTRPNERVLFFPIERFGISRMEFTSPSTPLFTNIFNKNSWFTSNKGDIITIFRPVANGFILVNTDFNLYTGMTEGHIGYEYKLDYKAGQVTRLVIR